MNLSQKKTSLLPPQYCVGQKNGNLIIREILPRSKTHPWTGKEIQRREFWYRVACKCGEFEAIHQSALRRRDCCLECAEDRRQATARANRARQRKVRLSDIPDSVAEALRMKW